MRGIMTLLFVVIISVSVNLAQPGNPGGNGQGGGQGNGNGQCPTCAPIDTDIWVLIIGGAIMGSVLYLRAKRESRLKNNPTTTL